jgi:hypothetical protein
MKKQIAMFFAAAATLALTSCGGGWTEENKTEEMSRCMNIQSILFEEDAETICKCSLEKLMMAFPDAQIDGANRNKIYQECSVNQTKQAEEAAEKLLNSGKNETPKDSLK